MTEFTGERVIPGQVGLDLWNEHIARYAFATRYALGRVVLDIGCGAGYGTAELAQQALAATGVDPAEAAIRYAREHYPLPNLKFVRASGASLPFRSGEFGVITAFEVVEHLSDWQAMLTEARRVLTHDGVFLVSTPNKIYYSESRRMTGPNPFHHHEFEFGEFGDALEHVFPSVTLLFQNRVEAFAFHPYRTFWPAEAHVASGAGGPDDAHFFVAICTAGAAPDNRSFVFVPRASNLLREREQHVELLETELAQNKDWLAQITAERDKLLKLFEEQTQQLEEHNRWALQLEQDWKAALQRVAQLQDELKTEQAAAQGVAANYACKVSELEEENRRKTQWALETEARLSADLSAKCDELAQTVRLLETAEATIEERTRWAQQLQSQVEQFEKQVNLLRASRWLRLGRALGLGPRI